MVSHELKTARVVFLLISVNYAFAKANNFKSTVFKLKIVNSGTLLRCIFEIWIHKKLLL